MSGFLLDTNIIIGMLNATHLDFRARLNAEFAASTPILLSSIVLMELRYGIARSQRKARSDAVLAAFLDMPFTLVAFTDADSRHAGLIRARLAAQGTPIGPYDVLIAAQALRCEASLVTLNRREFERVPGLTVNSWGAA